ncbi:hypothetical protein PVAND_002635 [Polypedilum vanderplanki]|uniref:Lethal giant larvae homologue 2 domain-containing protein n=1 Tax=Polypedilum vanderplanki TaxID=319348 RepID=A0A9J6BRS3_POLVA|nr:hypothetical protein PVAND_002635 [Polypedilum vanderplanki]
MLKFIRSKGHQQPSAERQKLQKELYAFRKTVQHGFPHKPSSLAYDSVLKLMAIGTTVGVIKVFGQPGVEFYGQTTPIITSTNPSPTDCTVQILEFIPGNGRLLSLTSNNQLTLWEPAGTLLVAIKTLALEKFKKVSTLCCSYIKDLLWIGTEGGNVYQFDLKTFQIKESTIFHDAVYDQLPASYKLNPGAIESIKQLPEQPHLLLIAYNRGLAVLWDLEESKVVRSYISPGHGMSVGIYVDQIGNKFTWYHADGSYATWDIESTNEPENVKYVPYGPDPCKAIDRLVRGFRGDNELIIFSGGMPRSAYGDHQCVSVHCKDGSKIALDFTSKVIDFFVTFKDIESANEKPQAEVLIVLLEEELVAYDLTQKSLPLINAPYLHSLHASAVTCNHLVSQVTAEVYDKIVQAGIHQYTKYSDITWPINGGEVPERANDSNVNEYDILLTGHEDGSVKFWDCSDICLTPLLHVKTAHLFGNSDDLDQPRDDDEPLEDDDEPPFRKAGQFDPYSDDPRLAVKKISLCPRTGVLIIAGTAGNIVVASIDDASSESTEGIKTTTMDLVSEHLGFVWKGHDPLKVKKQLLEQSQPLTEGVDVLGVLQIKPPAAITCLALQTKWGLLSAGTAHGLVLYDFKNNRPVLHKCTLNPNDLTGAGEQISRRKSFKKSLRESFRRLRKGRSTRNNNQPNIPAETRPVERQIEARAVDDGMGSMIRCLTFAQTYITNVNAAVPTLWSGTNSSCVSIFILHIPQTSGAATLTPGEAPRPIMGQLAKEIQIKHRAPVIAISLFDANNVPLDFQDGPGVGTHKVVIASEEQFKLFSLPQLKPINKYKLTAHEGARVRRMQFGAFTCSVSPDQLVMSPQKGQRPASPLAAQPASDNTDAAAPTVENVLYKEYGLLCLTNLGDVLVLSIPEFKRQLNAAVIRREDINGISSLCFTNHGEALYMLSSSEVQRVTLSATKIVSPNGAIDLEEWDDDRESESVDADNNLETEEGNENTTIEATTPISAAHSDIAVNKTEHLTNGVDSSPNSVNNNNNETLTSSMGDITIDSVRDHLNSTVTTLCSTTTEEIVGRLSVLSTSINNTTTSLNPKEILDIKTLKDTDVGGETNETHQNSVVVKSFITTISHGTGATNGETEKTTTTTYTRKESAF